MCPPPWPFKGGAVVGIQHGRESADRFRLAEQAAQLGIWEANTTTHLCAFKISNAAVSDAFAIAKTRAPNGVWVVSSIHRAHQQTT